MNVGVLFGPGVNDALLVVLTIAGTVDPEVRVDVLEMDLCDV